MGKELACTSTGRSSTGRRRFLRGLVAATSGAAALGVAARSGTAVAAAPEANTESHDESKGYRETQHIRDYYRTASF